ncbi:MAG: TerC/Alx family metal homeostasis membrane protein [Aeriscardovia sp.]|nr:TerC/Alx family metal homeostasis membrane protein [Aeriscardovia sp.]
MNETPVPFMVVTIIAVVLFFAVDLTEMARNPLIPTVKQCFVRIGVFIAAALIFGALLWCFCGTKPAIQFYSGWLTEYSLSIDNLFLFVLIMSSFAVPRKIQKYVLGVGIALALALRAIFIFLGAVILERFTWVFAIFGVFLLFTAGKMAFGKDDQDDEYHETALIRFARRHLHMTNTYNGTKMRVSVNGTKLFTPLLVVFVAIGTTDVLFAFDSIPAIFGLTKDPFIVFTSNVFALLGLEQLYFLLGNLLDKLRYLPIGLSVVLAFIGIKLILESLSSNTLPFINGGKPIPGIWQIPTWLSLIVIVVCIGGAAIASVLLADRNDKDGKSVTSSATAKESPDDDSGLAADGKQTVAPRSIGSEK